MILLDVLIAWSNFHNHVAVHSVVISSNHPHINAVNNDPLLQILSDDKSIDNHSLNRQKRVLVFRPLFVYKQQQEEKQKRREKWKAEQELQQQQYQTNYEQQYYQQYLQNYYSQFTSSSAGGYYHNYNQPNYPYPAAPTQNTYSNVDDGQLSYWNYNTDSDSYDNYYNPYQHSQSCYYPPCL